MARIASSSAERTSPSVRPMDRPESRSFQASSAVVLTMTAAGVTGEAFANPGKGKELALSLFDKDVDIIFHAAGSTGLGVFEAARARKKLAIGVDSDQYAEAPGVVLTSMVKKVDVAVFDAIKAVKGGAFKAGLLELDLAAGGVDYVYDEHNRAQIPDDARAKVEALRKEAEFTRTPVMALTASAMMGDRERALGAGFTGYCTKPIRLSALRAEVLQLDQSHG